AQQEFSAPAHISREAVATCPPGSAHMTGGIEGGGCRCGYGYGGRLRWDLAAGAYLGKCTRTACPAGASPGAYAGVCACDPPATGQLVWMSQDDAGAQAAKDAEAVVEAELQRQQQRQ
ncbi:unnamed protein product, partial [Polarella glacialis]